MVRQKALKDISSKMFLAVRATDKAVKGLKNLNLKLEVKSKFKNQKIKINFNNI